MDAIVKINDLSMKYQSANGEIEAISHIDLLVKKGEFVSIVGPSGCGKSTLLSMIAGLLSPTRGSILVGGRPAGKADPMIGYMLQKDHLFGWRTILQNALLGLEVRGRCIREDIDYVHALLKTYGLWEFRNKYPAQLSGGMRQRAALIRTLATRPEILLLDEAFSALDYQTRLAVCDDIYAIIRREGKTAVMVTHDISEAISMADRVIVLSTRPSQIVGEHVIRFAGDAHAPMLRREAPEFAGYFNAIWKELDIHV